MRLFAESVEIHPCLCYDSGENKRNGQGVVPMEKKVPDKFMRKTRLPHWKVISFLLLIYDAVAVNVAFLAALWLRFDCQFSLIHESYLSAWTATW